MSTLPLPSHNPPNGGLHPPKDEFRKTKSAWGLLVWAYADELAAAASSAAGGVPLSAMAGPSLAQSSWSVERIGRGSLAGWYEPPPDARLIDLKLREWFESDGEGLQRVISHAERRKLPASEIRLERLRPVPRLDRNDQPQVLRLRPSRDHKVVTEQCVLDYVGIDPVVAAARESHYREFYALFLAFLDAMPGFQFVRWNCQGRGLT